MARRLGVVALQARTGLVAVPAWVASRLAGRSGARAVLGAPPVVGAMLLAGALAGFGVPGGARAESARAPGPVIERAREGTQCVADPATMRREHPRMLEHTRDQTVHGGIRGAKASLKACIACHASPATGSVTAAETNFCVSCHTYAAVRIDCFECHATRPSPTAFHPIVPGGPQAAGAMRLAAQLRQMAGPSKSPAP